MTTMSTDIKERPILFSGEMVRAILDERKTQTRRVLKNTPSDARLDSIRSDGAEAGFSTNEKVLSLVRCPYGVPGDRLWVRESFMLTTPETPLYKASYGPGKHVSPWAPSIHMPRWASRITLEITRVRVERVQQISEADALAEGVSPSRRDFDGDIYDFSARDNFRSLWVTINGKRAPWVSNPWVWVLELKRCQLDSPPPNAVA